MDARKEAFGVSEGNRMRALIELLRHEPSIGVYLSAMGLSDSDIVAMRDGTLRGGDVSRRLYDGMLEGLEEGLRRLKWDDDKATKRVTEWATTPDEV